MTASLWAATARPGAAFAPLVGDARADVAIVGGGYTGLSCALHLAEAGARVVLLEAGDIGAGASGANGGQVNPGLRVSRARLTERFGAERGTAIADLADTAPDFAFRLIQRLGIECDARREGTIRVAHSEAALRAYLSAAEALAGQGVAVEPLDRAAAEETIGSRRYLGGYRDPRGGAVQPLDLARGLAASAARAGATIATGTRALTLRREGAAWRLVHGRGTLTAERVVVATNGYSDELVPGLRRSLLPVMSFQVATEVLAPDVARLILPQGGTVADSRRLILYWRKDAAGRVVIGGRASHRVAPAEADYRALARVLGDIYPGLRAVRLPFAWGGLVCITPDFMPHLHAPAPGLLACLGYNGRGVALALRMGELLAAALLGAADPVLPMTPIRPIPLHALRRPALHAAMTWHALLDRLGR